MTNVLLDQNLKVKELTEFLSLPEKQFEYLKQQAQELQVLKPQLQAN